MNGMYLRHTRALKVLHTRRTKNSQNDLYIHIQEKPVRRRLYGSMKKASYISNRLLSKVRHTAVGLSCRVFVYFK